MAQRLAYASVIYLLASSSGIPHNKVIHKGTGNTLSKKREQPSVCLVAINTL